MNIYNIIMNVYSMKESFALVIHCIYIPHTSGILVGFDEHFVQVTEGINNSINICGFVNSLTGIWKSNLSAILVVVNSTAKGLFCLHVNPIIRLSIASLHVRLHGRRFIQQKAVYILQSSVNATCDSFK